MAQQGVQLDQEQLCCSICLDLLKDPVTVPCGHSYCWRCIEGYWNQDDQRGKYSCPQCRQTFNPRPILKKNTMLAEVVESLRKTGLQHVRTDRSYAGPEDVACDFCTGRRLKAVKTCLQCQVSYCDTHIQPHYQSPAFKKHKLVNASDELQEDPCPECPHHRETLKLFCRTDQQCICSLCSVEEHKGHDIISAAAERTERQQGLIESQQKIWQRIQERGNDVEVLHQAADSINHFADRAAEDSDTVFAELISSIERKRTKVRAMIRDQQEHELSYVEELRRRVEQEASELRRRHAELEKLSLTEDHIHFLHNYTSSLSWISESTPPVSSHVPPLDFFGDVTVAVSKMGGKVEDILKEEGVHVSDTRTRLLPEPKTRADFLNYSCPIALDPNTAHQCLSLSNEDSKAVRMQEEQSYPDHQERFTDTCQVLSRDGLTGRSYWEVEWSGNYIGVAVSYEDIGRTGTQSAFGFNERSWSLQCTKQRYVFIHKDRKTEIKGSVSSRVGVYVDYSAGVLSFYSVSDRDTMSLLHTVHTKFTHKLRAGLWLSSCDGNTAELCYLK